MNALNEQCFNNILEFLGKPDQDLQEREIRVRFTRIFNISFVSRACRDLYLWWYDNDMDIMFHH